MLNVQEIAKGIGAHGMWKQRIVAAIQSGKADITPEQAERDNACEFGRWLYSLSPAEQNTEHFKKVQALHAAFHKEAGRILRMALGGQGAAAEKGLAFGGTYANVSTNLTSAMMEWKKALGG